MAKLWSVPLQPSLIASIKPRLRPCEHARWRRRTQAGENQTKGLTSAGRVSAFRSFPVAMILKINLQSQGACQLLQLLEDMVGFDERADARNCLGPDISGAVNFVREGSAIQSNLPRHAALGQCGALTRRIHDPDSGSSCCS